MKALTGQYECVHSSGLGLDFFTSRLDRLTLFANGRFTLITQDKSRLMHAAKSLVAGQQTTMEAQETRSEGNYTAQNTTLILQFDDGEQEKGQILENGLEFGKDFYEKVSESTLLPPQHRLKNNMEDIAKGIKIAGAIGGTVLKAARTIQDTMQTQNQAGTSTPAQGTAQSGPYAQSVPPQSPSNAQAAPPRQAPAPTPAYTPPVTPEDETFFCDQCGSPVRPGKKFCNHCGAKLY